MHVHVLITELFNFNVGIELKSCIYPGREISVNNTYSIPYI